MVNVIIFYQLNARDWHLITENETDINRVKLAQHWRRSYAKEAMKLLFHLIDNKET